MRLAAIATLVLALGLVLAPVALSHTGWAGGSGSGTVSSGGVSYSAPVRLPAPASSPSVDALAPYTPVVMSLISQLEPSNPPTLAELSNADQILVGGTNAICHNVGTNGAPSGTTPAITPLCWSDAQGVNVTSGPNVGKTTAPMEMEGLAGSFDRQAINAWGQAEGKEARELMVTGMLGPQVDLSIFSNWGRGVNSSSGEDPYLGGQMSASFVNGLQGAGAMAQMKHFGPYNGTNEQANTTVPDQALHEMRLAPFENGFTSGLAAAVMASYHLFEDDTPGVPSTGVNTLTQASPYSGASTTTWPLNESHFSSEQPLILTYSLRDLWGSKAAVGPDYGGEHSSSNIVQGQDFSPDADYLGTTDPGQPDPTGSTCASATGTYESCSTPGAVHVGGIPNDFEGSGGSGCPTNGCGVVNAVSTGNLPLSVFNQSVARMLYLEQRFGLLGCDQTSVAPSCTNPGGVDGDRTGTAPLPTGPSSGQPVVGTKNGDAAIVEKGAEEGAVLFKNDGAALPISAHDLSGGVAVSGAGGEYTVAAPFNEAATGFSDQDAIGPLEQLKNLSGNPSAFTFTPALDPSGEPVPSSALSTSNSTVTGNLERANPDGTTTSDSTIDYTTASGHGQLTQQGTYTWTGYVYVPTADTYTFRFQYTPSATVTFALDGQTKTLTGASTFYTGWYYGGGTGGPGQSIPVSPTVAGYTEAGLTNDECQTTSGGGGGPPGGPPGGPSTPASELCPSGTLSAGYHQVTITFDNTTSSPASFRFAYSRANGDIADAANAAKGKRLAIVFANDSGVSFVSQGGPSGVSTASQQVETLPSSQVQLIEAVAAANPNTVVVLNTGGAAVVQPWIKDVKAVLEMWNSGEEGGTATARLLLGQADPSGHTPLTWPINGTDTVYGYNEPASGLYPGSTAGTHPERLNGAAGGTSVEDEGIYTGYRYFDKLGIPVQFPFGYGLSYTSFRYSGLQVQPSSDGGADVSFNVQNTGRVAGADVAQIYVGAPTDQPAGVQFAVRALAQFQRVQLWPGQSERVWLHVAPRQLSYWSASAQQWVLDPNGRTVYVGDADAPSDLPLRATLREQSGNLVCTDESLNATTIDGNLYVPHGSWCDLVAVKVDRNVLLRDAAGLRLINSTVNGSLVARRTYSADDPASTGANVVCSTTIRGGVVISGGWRGAPWDIGGCGADTIGGSADLATPGVTISSTTVSGRLVCADAGITGSKDTVNGKTEGCPAALTSTGE